ncbi:MAG: endolytic transglycosylase MltG [Candidatus Gottesmanbacteria bacterium]|nr:endolytic transglycosylase MltG [Candidatus Gottesmanbacteria bacterium]
MKSNKSYPFRLLLFLIVTVVIATGAWAWWRDAINSADSSQTTSKIFVVRRGEGVKSIAARLASDGLIRSPTGFYLLVKMMGIERSLQAGDYRLNAGMDAGAIAKEMTHGTLDVWVTTLEGWRVEEVAAKLSKELDIPESEFAKVAREGYMFPDTYLFPKDATVGAVARLFFSTFDAKVDEKMRADVKKTGLTFDEALTLASIVEREGRTEEDRPMIAGILLNRLKADWPLQADATLQYALGYQSSGKTWWKKELYDEDKTVKSPYNTYLHKGLPPGPIANPGIISIKAVIYPKTSDYWYYIHDPKGVVHYGRTLEEHNRNIAKYLQ